MEKPIVNEVFTDNGDISHYELIEITTGNILWSSFPEETIAMGRKITPLVEIEYCKKCGLPSHPVFGVNCKRTDCNDYK